MSVRRMRNWAWVAVVIGSAWVPSARALEDNGGYTISDVAVRQRWPWSRKVDVDFRLANPEGVSPQQAVEIGVAASNGTEEVTLSPESLAGTVGVLPGYRRIVWDPTVDHAGASFLQLTFHLSVAETNGIAPAYMVVDLTTGGIDYRDASFSNEVNSTVYKTDRMAFRYIAPGAFSMGMEGSGVDVALTKGFYIGVFEVTQAQWKNVMGTSLITPCYTIEGDMRPVEQVGYNDIRGTVCGTNWPAGSEVDMGSFLGVFRLFTRVSTFDLPTEALWEYACRAGTTTYYNDGLGTPGNITSNAQMDVLGRYTYNGGKINGTTTPSTTCGPTNATAIVGSYLPNAWGLYDTHGNVWEWCLDWYGGTLSGGENPVGAVSGSSRVRRGGSWDYPASICRSAYRSSGSPSLRSHDFGFRLVRTLP